MYSYHIFYHPFKWKIRNSDGLSFDKQTDLNKIQIEKFSSWEHMPLPENNNVNDLEDIYNEKNYYYKFVHPVLYDTGEINGDLIHHYERKEPKEGFVNYKIETKNRLYILKVDAININLYATGVGIMSFFLINDKEDQAEPSDILDINQFGRRILPAYFKDKDNRTQIAKSLSITGLHGTPSNYKEDFNGYRIADSWKAANFITNLIADLSANIETVPVIDDRMYVNCWYGKSEKIKQFTLNEHEKIFGEYNSYLEKSKLASFVNEDFWYQYVFVDSSNDSTCKNAQMRATLLDEATYYRWQEYGTLYGVSRYSFLVLTGDLSEDNSFIPVHIRTLYSRMVELCLVQRASILRFSEEITNLGKLKSEKSYKLSEKISALYKLYIRFINQIYFREITAQDQGIELYKMLRKNMAIDQHVKDLDGEIEELHRYVTFTEEHAMNRQMAYLTIIATIFLPVTIITGFFGMNEIHDLVKSGWCSLCWQIAILIFALLITWIAVLLLKRKYK